MIHTNHIVKMLEEATALAREAAAVDAEHGIEGQEQTLPGRQGGATTWTALQRAANLAEHTAHELQDEYLRSHFRWPVV